MRNYRWKVRPFRDKFLTEHFARRGGGRKSNVRWRYVGNSWIGWKTDGNEIWLARWKSDASAGSKGPTLIWSAKCRRWLRGWIDSVGVGGAPWATIEGERQRKGGEREGAYVHRCRCARVRRAKPGCRSVVVGDSKQFQECVACVSSALIWFTNRFLRPDYPLVLQLYLHPATYPPKPSLPRSPLSKIYRAYVTFRPRN